jgi:hypothetical protein
MYKKTSVLLHRAFFICLLLVISRNCITYAQYHDHMFRKKVTSHQRSDSTDKKKKLSYQVGVGGADQLFHANEFVIRQPHVVTVDYGDPQNETRLSLYLLMNWQILKRLNLETGLRYYDIWYDYYVNYTPPNWSLGYRFAGDVRSTVFTLPLNAEFGLIRPFYIKGGLSLSIAFPERRGDATFQTVPSEVSEIYNGLRDIFSKRIVLNRDLGIGLILWRFDIAVVISTSMTKVAHRYETQQQSYSFYTKVNTTQIAFTYHFQARKKAL